ncbi:protein TIC 62, chloroplastic-like [Zingiber officinale]|uniref:protein TIC 62, chloroplastic-like n=1 Tax=Zingiber officinale TaxID=94328 RepID=UPI001C4D3483|nr:protein TIC 62, chloroplastic-like [Zingiber officinale]XP_042427931.1 protein TIC 62, chloroplastic-like [Zingiber officinale]
MEVVSLCSQPCAARLPLNSRARNSMDRSAAISGRFLLFPRTRSLRDGNPLRHISSSPRHPGSIQAASSSISKELERGTQETSSKDKDLAFVAGATGRVGSRLVRELLKLGFRVRAGVRNAQRAEPLLQSVRQMKLDLETGTSGTEPAEKLEIVECDLEKKGDILPAIGNASVLLCCIGASEKEISDITGPYRIDYKATENLIRAATIAKVDHFILLTSLGTNKIGFPAAILNLFWGVLIWKRKAEEALIASGLPYTIVRPGGMERPTDSYKETHNLVLANEDTYFGGQVSNLQVAELMACMARNKKLSYCKIVEVIADTTAPLLSMEELLAKIRSKREPPAETLKDLAPPSDESKPLKPIIKDASAKMQEKKLTPLSPYAMYENLKPPSSPTPIPSTSGSSNEINEEFVQSKSHSEPTSAVVTPFEQIVTPETRPLSPYTAYEDLKPPVSPTPSLPT